MKIDSKKIITLLFLHPILITVYPVIRILIFGSGAATNFAEMFYGFLPDLYLYSLCFLSVLNNWEKLCTKKNYTTIDYSVILFFIVNVIIGLVFMSNIKAGYQAFRLTYLPVLGYFILWLNFEKTHFDWVTKLLHKVFVWYFIIAICGLLLYFVFPDFENYLINRSGGKHFFYLIRRMGSFIFNPVPLGTILSVASLYYSHLLISRGDKKFYFILIILLISLLLTVSRGAIIAYVFAAIIYLMFTKFTKRSIWLLLIWVSTFLSFSFVVSNLNSISDFFSNKQVEAVNEVSSGGNDVNLETSTWMYNSTMETAKMDSSVSRVKLWKSSFEDFKARPFGYGFGNSGHIATQYFGKNNVQSKAAIHATDGWFVKLATETGIIGMLTYLLLCIAIGYTLIANKTKIVKSFYLFFACFFILVNVQNVGSNVLDYFSFAPIFWIMISIFSLKVKTGENESN